jgi:hypothetical protein
MHSGEYIHVIASVLELIDFSTAQSLFRYQEPSSDTDEYPFYNTPVTAFFSLRADRADTFRTMICPPPYKKSAK